MNTDTPGLSTSRSQRARTLRVALRSALLPLLLLLLTAVLPCPVRAQNADPANATIAASDKSWVQKVFRRHIEGLGFILWGQDTPTGQALIGQVRGTGAKSRLDARANPKEKSVPDPVLKLPGLDGLRDFVLILRMQNSLDVDESKAQAATYQWISDAQAGDYWNLDAAAILDWYFPLDTENRDRLANFFAYRPEKRAAHLRTGFAWERITTGGGAAAAVDLREVFVGIGYRRLLNQGKADKPEPDKEQSEFQIGLNYKDNAVTNDSQWSVDLNVQPVFKLFHGIPFFEKFEKYLPGAIGEHWAFGRQDPPVAAAPGRITIEPTQVEVTSANSPLEQLRQYLYIKPNFSFKSVFSDLAKGGGNVNPGDYQFDWGTRFGVGFMHDAFRLSYQLSGVTPIEQIGGSFIYQEARAEYRPTIDSPIVFSARYSKGKRAPSYINEDRVILAVGVKF